LKNHVIRQNKRDLTRKFGKLGMNIQEVFEDITS